MWRRSSDESGLALVITVMAMGLMLALGTMLVLTTMTETAITANYREGVEAIYAADAVIERVLQDVAATADWDTVLNGLARSSFVDGPAGGTRQIAGGAALDLTGETNMLRCGTIATCSGAAMDAVTQERPWGRNNPRWQLYGYGPLADMLPAGQIASHLYVVVWIGDDAGENDGNPWSDGQAPAMIDARNPDNLGRGVLALVAHAYGPGGSRRVVEATVSRADPEDPPGSAKMRILAWRERR